MESILIVIAALLVDNLLLTKLFGVESFFTASEKPSMAMLYGGIVSAVTVVSGTAMLCIYRFIYEPLKITFLTTFTAVIVITCVISAIQLISAKISHKAHAVVEATIPMVASNCVVIGSIMLCLENNLSFGMSVLYLLAAGIGFSVVMLIFSGIQKRFEVSTIPDNFRGIPILLLSCAIAAMAFSGFYGLSF